MILEVTIKAPPGGTNRTLRFTKSPIRIGRNQLNDISLEDPFVSEWHGTLRFDTRSVAYFDLGSTNGTLLDGKRLAKNLATELSDTSRLQLGLLELLVSRVASEPEPAPRPAGTGPHKTLAWGRADVVAAQGSAQGQGPAPGAGYGPGPGVGSGSNVGPGYGPGPGAPRPGSAGQTPFSAGRTPPPVAFTPAPAAFTPPPLAATPVPPAARPPAHGQGVDSPTGVGAITSDAGRKDSDASAAAHQRKLLQAFCEAFIGLRKGYEQFGAEVGVRTINGSTPLHRARSSRELLDYLNQPNVDAAVAARDLIAIFADFGIHHIAMMQGVTEGARAMLQSLNPQANDVDAKGRLFSKGKSKDTWKAYLERFEQMLTDDNELHAAIFGNEFARAYASVTLGDGGKPPKEGTD